MQQEQKQKGKNGLLGVLAVLGIAIAKFKVILLLLLSKGWIFLKSGLSMILMIGTYTIFFGPVYALVVVGLILIHELGHFIFMKFYGLDPKWPVFIPFLGAYVAMTKLPPDQATDAWVSLAGPLVGGLTSVMFFYYGVNTHNPLLMAAGSTGCFLNLFQLIPAKPFDGGFIVNAVAKWVMVPGVFVVFTAAAVFKSPILFMFALVSAYSTWKTFTGAPSARDMIKPASRPEKIMIGLAYFTLAGALGTIYSMSSNELVSFMPASTH